MQVGDIIVVSDTAMYRVSGVYYGVEGEQTLVGLVCLSKKPGNAHGKDVHEMIVPIDLILAIGLVTPQGVYRKIGKMSL